MLGVVRESDTVEIELVAVVGAERIGARRDGDTLRERREDIPYLAHLFVNQLVSTTGGIIKGLSPEAEMQLQSMSFPGNVRELKNIIERAVALCDAPWIGVSNLSDLSYRDQESGSVTLRESLEEAEIRAIKEALAENENKIKQAADALGISRKNLWEKMKRLNINKRE